MTVINTWAGAGSPPGAGYLSGTVLPHLKSNQKERGINTLWGAGVPPPPLEEGLFNSLRIDCAED